MKKKRYNNYHKLSYGGFDFGSLAGSIDKANKSIDGILANTGVYDKLGVNAGWLDTNLSGAFNNGTMPQASSSSLIPQDIKGELPILGGKAVSLNPNMGSTFMDAYSGVFSNLKPFALGGNLFVTGGLIGSAIEGAASVAQTAVETSKANLQLRNRDMLANINSRNNAILNTSALNVSSDDGLLSLSRNLQNAYGIDKSQLMRRKGLNVWTTALGTNKAALQGASAGAKVGGPWGALFGGLAGTAAGLFGGIHGSRENRRIAERESSRALGYAKLANMSNDSQLDNAVERTIQNNYFKAMSGLHAFGGKLETNGGMFSSGITTFDNGGTHEENPNNGIPLGIAPDGVPNLVEEGEVKWDAENYIFSNRLKVPEELIKKYKLKKDSTYADAAKKLSKEIEERPNDPISKNGLNASYSDLAESLEELKMEQLKKLLEKMLANMTPEERNEFAQAVQQAQAQQMQEQIPQESQALELPLEYLDPSQDMSQLLSDRGFAKGGHLFVDGGIPFTTRPESDEDIPDLDELINLNVPIDPYDFNSDIFNGALDYYLDPRYDGTILSNPEMTEQAAELEKNKDYQEDTRKMLIALKGNKGSVLSPKEYEKYIKAAKGIDAKAKSAGIKDYIPLFDDNGDVNEKGVNDFVHRRNDLKYGPYHVYLNRETDRWEPISRIPPSTPPQNPPKTPPTLDPPNIDIPGIPNKLPTWMRYAPIGTSLLNYLEALDLTPHLVNAPGTAYIGPQTNNEFAAYKPQDVLALWNKQSAALRGISNDIRQGNGITNDAARIAAMNQMSNAYGNLISDAQEQNYKNYLAAKSHNASIVNSNNANIMHADEYNANAYRGLLENLMKAALQNNEYIDNVFNARLAARNNFGNLMGKLGESNNAINQFRALANSGYYGPMSPGSKYLLDLSSRKLMLKELEDLKKLNVLNIIDLNSSISNLVNTSQMKPIVIDGLTWNDITDKDLDDFIASLNSKACGGKINTKKYTKRKK